MNHIEKESKIVLFLAIVGIAAVVVIVSVIFLLERADSGLNLNADQTNDSSSDNAGSDTNANNISDQAGQKTDKIFDRPQYGIKFNYAANDSGGEYTVVENKGAGEQVNQFSDCRKMSDTMRSSLASSAACYNVQVKLDDASYIVISTGDAFYTDPEEQYLKSPDNPALRIYPSSKINLPIKRIDISSFPTNFQGEQVNYEGGQSRIFYKGVVYKGADKYAILVAGDINEKVLSFLKGVELE